MKRNARLIALLLSLMTVLSALSSCAMEDFQDILSKFTPPAETSAKAPSPTQAETTHGSSSDDDHAFPSGTVPGETVPNESYYGETIPNETFLGNFTELPTAPQTALTTTSDDFIQICPPEIKLDREMNIFVGTLYYDEWLEADDGDIVGTELYNRVPRAEHNLDIKLEIVNHVGTGTDKQAIMDEIAKRQESTDPNMIADLCSTYSMFAGSLTVDGRYQNIANSDYVNFDNPWWPADLLENSTIDDKVYFVSGDISPTMIYETYAVFFNPELIEKFNLDDPIKLVNEKRWTLDKVIEITSGIYDDLDEVSGPSEGDFFAFNFNDAAHLKAFPFGMGVRVIVPDSDDGYAFTEDYWGGKMENISNRMNAWIGKNNGVKSPSESGFGDYGVSFKNERCIFTVGNIAFATHYLSGLNVDYGIVPAPMFDEKQEQY